MAKSCWSIDQSIWWGWWRHWIELVNWSPYKGMWNSIFIICSCNKLEFVIENYWLIHLMCSRIFHLHLFLRLDLINFFLVSRILFHIKWIDETILCILTMYLPIQWKQNKWEREREKNQITIAFYAENFILNWNQ